MSLTGCETSDKSPDLSEPQRGSITPILDKGEDGEKAYKAPNMRQHTVSVQ